MYKTLFTFLKIAGINKKKILLSYFYGFIESVFASMPMLILMFAFNRIINGTLHENDCIILSLIMFAVLYLRAKFRYLSDKNNQGQGLNVFERERIKIANHLTKLNMGYFTNNNIGEVNALLASDITYIENVGTTFMGILATSTLGAIIPAVILFVIDYRVAVIYLIVMLLVILVLNWFGGKALEWADRNAKIQQTLIGNIIEYIKGIPVVKSFNLVKGKHKKTAEDFAKLRDIQIEGEKNPIIASTTVMIIMALGTMGVIYVAGVSILQDSMPLYLAVSLLIMSNEIFSIAILLTSTVAIMNQVLVVVKRYTNLLNSATLNDTDEKVELSNFDIKFNNVTFGYTDKTIIKNISFTAPEKSMTALVGKSGSGKSTIVNLINRFWEINDGSITIGGVDIRDMSIESLYKNISMVFQKVFLFNDSIYNNILLGDRSASYEQVVEACKKACCYDFILALPNGFDTVVGENGVTLSGGEKQRISIARAILKDAPIILLDEATASVDPDNEYYIQIAINELVKNKTLIVIAHKLSCVMNADNIIVIDDGNIIEQGNHKELLKKDGLYKRLFTKRLNSRAWSIHKGEK